MKSIISFKSIFALATALMLSMASVACAFDFSNAIVRVEPSGVEATRTGSLAQFNKLDVSSSVDVSFVLGEDYGYTFTTDSALINKFEITFEDSKFTVGPKNNASFHWGSYDDFKVSLVIKVPDYNAFSSLDVELSGATTITLPEFNMASLKVDMSGASRALLSSTKVAGLLVVDCSGASKFDSENISAAEIESDCSGASTAIIKGETSKFDCECSGASSAQTSDLKVKEYAKYDCSGASKVYAGDLTDVVVEFEASGASSISYQGTPKINRKEVSGASHVG